MAVIVIGVGGGDRTRPPGRQAMTGAGSGTGGIQKAARTAAITARRATSIAGASGTSTARRSALFTA